MTNTLYGRIETLKFRGDWGKSNITSLNFLHSIIDEMAERLEKAHQLFQDLDDSIKEHELSALFQQGMDLTDIVQDYPLEETANG